MYQASHLISILLREQNARCQREINTARANIQADMIKFVDKLTDALSTRAYAARLGALLIAQLELLIYQQVLLFS